MTETKIQFVIEENEEMAIAAAEEGDNYSEEEAINEIADWEDSYKIFKVTTTHVVEVLKVERKKTFDSILTNLDFHAVSENRYELKKSYADAPAVKHIVEINGAAWKYSAVDIVTDLPVYPVTNCIKEGTRLEDLQECLLNEL